MPSLISNLNNGISYQLGINDPLYYSNTLDFTNYTVQMAPNSMITPINNLICSNTGANIRCSYSNVITQIIPMVYDLTFNINSNTAPNIYSIIIGKRFYYENITITSTSNWLMDSDFSGSILFSATKSFNPSFVWLCYERITNKFFPAFVDPTDNTLLKCNFNARFIDETNYFMIYLNSTDYFGPILSNEERVDIATFRLEPSFYSSIGLSNSVVYNKLSQLYLQSKYSSSPYKLIFSNNTCFKPVSLKFTLCSVLSNSISCIMPSVTNIFTYDINTFTPNLYSNFNNSDQILLNGKKDVMNYKINPISNIFPQ
jgi:hypothetical protein